jgi:tyrosine-protein kinase Etk/Wzc
MNESLNGTAKAPVQILEKDHEFNLREFIARYVRYLPWIIASVILSLLVAYVYLRYTTPVFQASGKMMLKKQTANSARDRFDDIFVLQGTSNVADEIEQMKSTSITRRVVVALNFQVTYYNKGNIRTSLLHQSESPLVLIVGADSAERARPFSLNITVKNDREFAIEGAKDVYYFNQPIVWGNHHIEIRRTATPFNTYVSPEYTIVYQPVDNLARMLSNSIFVKQAADFSNVLNLTYETTNPLIASDVVNAFMDAYQDASLEEKRQIAINTLVFIDDQLDTLRRELGGVERNLQNFRETNRVLNVESQSSLFLNNANGVEKDRLLLQVKLRVVDYLISYLKNEANAFKTPSTLGIDEPALLQSILEYNRLQLERQSSLKTIPAANPIIVDVEKAIAKLRGDIMQSLYNVRESYLMGLNSLQQQTSVAEKEIQGVPGKQKRLLEITRQQKILEELYSFLLQKKLETSIVSVSTVSSSRIIEAAVKPGWPIRPQRGSIYAMAVLIGLVLPIGIVFILQILNDKIQSRSDIEKISSVPMLGEVGHSINNDSALILANNNRSYVAEQFRIIRSNLQYFVPKQEKPVILITSSFMGEGKSFVSTNIGAVLAMSGKKTVILEFDIRKPKILKGLNMAESRGITNFVVSAGSLEPYILPVPQVDNLYVIPCGPIPPNPGDLLLDNRIKDIFEYLHKHFDAVIVDTAPVGMVSDAIVLGAYVNTSVYIVRHNYTFKKQLRFINDLYKESKLPKMSIVINDVKAQKGYGNYYGYGYGYGYGQKNSYFEENSKGRKNRKSKKLS